MVVVKKQRGETENQLISRFRKISSRLIKEYRERARYEKPAEKRKKEKYIKKYRIELEKKRAIKS